MTIAAGNLRHAEHSVADLSITDRIGAELDDLAGDLMAQDATDRRHAVLIDGRVKVRAADPACDDLQDRLCGPGVRRGTSLIWGSLSQPS
jgi:hypothetical protein